MNHQTWNDFQNDPERLVEARLQLHYAVQPVGSAGDSLLPNQADYSQMSLEYDPALHALTGMPFENHKGLRAALIFEGLTLALIADGGVPLEKISLFDRSLDDGMQWMKDALTKHGVDTAEFKASEYGDFPGHPLGNGARFDPGQAENMQAVSLYFSNTFLLLKDIAAKHSGASPIKLWPHHFDLATLITVKKPSEPGGEDGVSVGAGVSPGDGGTPVPYWYVTPWPYPDKDTLPELPAGRWNTDGWVGALLSSKEIAGSGDQQKRTRGFLEGAVDGLLDLIG